MAESYYGGVNITTLLAALSDKHTAFQKDKNGQIWCNVKIWINQEKDRFGNAAAMQLSSKEHAANEKKIYIGNFKKDEPKDKPVTNSDIEQTQKQFSTALDESDLPF